tara:strand:- start:3560 stop:4177 length:618 start_codon:yes stop_codon:yes gene_type:complete
MEEQIKNGYLEIPNFKFDQNELIDIVKDIDENDAWIYSGLVGDYVQEKIPSSIRENFQSLIHTWMGFVKCKKGSSVLPHKDSQYKKYSKFFGDYALEESYSRLDNRLHELKIQRNGFRECALFFPVYGDYNESPTILYREKDLKEIARLSLQYPTLVELSGGTTLHGVAEVFKDRVTFQMSFYTPLSFKVVSNLLLTGKILNEAY